MLKFEKARQLIRQFKGDTYLFGFDLLEEAGRVARELGKSAVLVRDRFPGSAPFVEKVEASLRAAGIDLLGSIDGAAPNAPREATSKV
jgi:alcohol dehydrogenase